MQFSKDKPLITDDAVSISIQNEFFVDEFEGIEFIVEEAFGQINSAEASRA